MSNCFLGLMPGVLNRNVARFLKFSFRKTMELGSMQIDRETLLISSVDFNHENGSKITGQSSFKHLSMSKVGVDDNIVGGCTYLGLHGDGRGVG